MTRHRLGHAHRDVVLEKLRRGREPEPLHARHLAGGGLLGVHARRLRLELVVHGVHDIQRARRARAAAGCAARVTRRVFPASFAVALAPFGRPRAFGSLARRRRGFALLARRLRRRLAPRVVLHLVERDEEVRHQLEDAPAVVGLERLAEKLRRAFHRVARRRRERARARHVFFGALGKRDHDVPEPVVRFFGAFRTARPGIRPRRAQNLVVDARQTLLDRIERLFGAVQMQRGGARDAFELVGEKFNLGRALLELLRHEVQQGSLAVHRLDVRQPK